MFAWGFNETGQIGNGTGSQAPSPVQLAAFPSPIVEVAAGTLHSLRTRGGWNGLGLGQRSCRPARHRPDADDPQHADPGSRAQPELSSMNSRMAFSQASWEFSTCAA